MLKRTLARMLLLSVVIIGLSAAAGYSEIDLWPGIQNTGTASVQAYLYSWNFLSTNSSAYAVAPSAVIQLGLYSNLDAIYVGSLSQALFRYDFSGGNNLGILGVGIGTAAIAPQYNLSFTAGPFNLVANVVASVPYASYTNTAFTVGVAPAFTFNNVVDIYAELIPSYTLNVTNAFNFNAAIGIDLIFTSDFGMSFGPYISAINTGSPQLALEMEFWYNFTAK